MRPQTPREELANALTHGVGALAAAGALPVMVVAAARRGAAADVVGGAVFGATLVLLYLASALYHAAPAGRWKERLRRVDHGAIFLLIAGTYTPFTLGVLGGGWGWSLFGVVWGLAVVGATAKLTAGVRRPVLSTVLYVGMGWLVLVAAPVLWARIAPAGLVLLVAGGLAYTAGVAFYAAPRIRYAHAVWHLFVLAGSTLHVLAVLLASP